MITVLSINLLAHGLHNKMELPNVSYAICWMLPVLSLCICMFPSRWIDAVFTTCYLVNRMHSTVLGFQIPHVLFFDRPLYTLPPHVFGCTCYVHTLDPGCEKIDPWAIKYVFLGYFRTQKGYKCYSPVLRHTFVCVDVTFNESYPIFLLPLGILSTIYLLVFPLCPWLPLCPVPRLSSYRFMFVAIK